MLVRVLVQSDEPLVPAGRRRALWPGQSYDLTPEAVEALGDKVQVIEDGVAPQPLPPTEDPDGPVSDRTSVRDLRRIADERGVDIKGMLRKGDIITAINEA